MVIFPCIYFIFFSAYFRPCVCVCVLAFNRFTSDQFLFIWLCSFIHYPLLCFSNTHSQFNHYNCFSSGIHWFQPTAHSAHFFLTMWLFNSVILWASIPHDFISTAANKNFVTNGKKIPYRCSLYTKSERCVYAILSLALRLLRAMRSIFILCYLYICVITENQKKVHKTQKTEQEQIKHNVYFHAIFQHLFLPRRMCYYAHKMRSFFLGLDML